MKKILLMCMFPLIIILCIIVFISSLIAVGFFNINVTDGYVENNSAYASKYKQVLNEYIVQKNLGYVPLERILYFYDYNDTLNFSDIYLENLDQDLKQMKPISSVCSSEEYKNYLACDDLELENSNQIDEYQNKPFAMPIDFSKMSITSFFMQERVINGEYDIHKAWDLAISSETNIYSVCEGKVIKSSFPYKENKSDTNGGYGNYLTIQCNIDDTIYKITYAHLFPDSSNLLIGDSVIKGQNIAKVGTTGNSTGSHIHFQVQTENDSYIDGMSLIDFNNYEYKN